MAQAREVGVPTAEVLGLEHLEHNGELLSFSIQQFLPGRSLAELIGELSAPDLERLVTDAGEILARVHSVVPDDERGIRHELRVPEEREVTRVARIVREELGPEAAAVVKRGADFLRKEVTTRPAPPFSLVQGDFLPQEPPDSRRYGRPASSTGSSPALRRPHTTSPNGRWMPATPCMTALDLVRRGYARVADPESADAGWTAAFAIDWTLEKLGWKNPASPAQFQRCVDVIARHTTS